MTIRSISSCPSAVIALLACTLGAAATAVQGQGVPEFPAEFASALQCPFSRLWLQHGPEKAWDILRARSQNGVSDRRRLDETTGAPVAASRPFATFAAGGPPPERCTIAPGPMGGGHQHSQSPGYSDNCEGTPGQQSPYMWPLKWQALFRQKALQFGSDEVTFEQNGRVSYSLERNWKRHDIYYQNGVQFGVGQAPCPPGQVVDGNPMKCLRTPTNRTIIHRNSLMYFFDYAPGGREPENIVNCTYLNLAIVGNIRPDWFLDRRGDNSDVMYLGDSHVFWDGQPKLVKQWRKQDFVNQYFTMSMQGIPGDDGIHWPLIL